MPPPDPPKAPTVSVCVPCINGARYLRAAAASIAAQEFGDFELIIVDDLSTDETLAIAGELAAKDPRIRVFRNETNLGLVGNWNRCVELARGEWIKFVFQDDLIAPGCLGRMLDAADATRRRIVFCERDVLIESDADPFVRGCFETGLLRFCAVIPGRTFVPGPELSRAIVENIGTNFFGEPTSTLIHRSTFFRHGMFKRDYHQLCDLEYWCRAGCHEGVAYVPERLATFRVHGTASTTVNSATASARLTRHTFEVVRLHVAYLLDPEYDPLRNSADDAVDRMRSHFMAVVDDIERELEKITEADERAALEATWRAVRASSPGIDLLRRGLRSPRQAVRSWLRETWRHRVRKPASPR